MRKTALAAMIAGALTVGCGKQPEQQGAKPTVVYRFNYEVEDAHQTGLVRAFHDGSHTILQFLDIGGANPEITDAGGNPLLYKVVGPYAVLTQLAREANIKSGGRASRVYLVQQTRNDAPGLARKPATQTASAAQQSEREFRGASRAQVSDAQKQDADALRQEYANLSQKLGQIAAELGEVRKLLVPVAAPALPTPVRSPLSKFEHWVVEPGKATLLVSFPRGSTQFTITDENANKLLAASKVADEIVVRGRTDSNVANRVNDKIAHGRAESVMKYLMTKEIEPNKIKCFWYPARLFIADNRTPEGKTRNRRVEIEAKGANIASAPQPFNVANAK
jgi:outer membrane protein OmpA-like peptidoglycan-associated protein